MGTRSPRMIRSAEGKAEYHKLSLALAEKQITINEFVEQARAIRDAEARREHGVQVVKDSKP
jgi:hypothetical protein